MSLSVMLQQLASGMVVSVEIFVVTLLFSLPLGLLICFGRMSKNPAIRGIVSAYISVLRGTPLCCIFCGDLQRRNRIYFSGTV